MERELFVVAGLNRLTVPVVQGLCARRAGAEVVVVATEPDRVYGPMVERCGAAMVYAERGMEPALREAVDLGRASCLLAIADSDLENVRAAIISHEMAPAVPIVVRLFDRVLADHLERSETTAEGHVLRVRRAYSMSALSAPKFLAAALGQADTHLLTMRFADVEIPFLSVTAGEGSPVVGWSVDRIERRFGCAVVAHRRGDGAWSPGPEDDVTVSAGDGLVVGGPEVGVFRMAAENDPGLRSVPAGPTARIRRLPRRRTEKREAKNITLLPRVAIGLGLVTVASMVVVGVWGGHQRFADAFFWTITAAASGSPAGETNSWLRYFAAVPIVAGGALAGVLFSYLASVATAQRLEQRIERTVSRMRGHVVIGGLGTVGYRVERLLWRLDVPTVVVELGHDSQFASGLQSKAPVLRGDIRLTSTLERSGIETASCIIAVTDDDLVNVEACLTARNLNPGIRTVARIFDDTLADRARDAFGIDACFSAVQSATPAFIDAATDPYALRCFSLDGAEYCGLRYIATRRIEADEVARWRNAGIRVVATRHLHDAVRATALLDEPLDPGDSAIVAGPSAAVQRLANTGSL